MAHRLPAAGVQTQRSDHFSNYQVWPKHEPPQHAKEDQGIVCCLKPTFMCLSQPSGENRCPVNTTSRHDDCCCCPVCVKCCLAPPQQTPKKCCISKSCCCAVCCDSSNRKITSGGTCYCCPISGEGCSKKRTCTIKITLPGGDDNAQEQKMLKKMKKLRKDIMKFDQALSCLEKRPSASRPCPFRVRADCCCRKTPVARQVCYVPVRSQQKQQC